MRRKLLHALVAFATFVVVWLVASPAFAATGAPLCDPRGAVGFAPPPQIQDAETSLDLPADCVDVNPLDFNNVIPGHPPASSFDMSSQEPMTTPAEVLLTLVFVERAAAADIELARPPPGVRSSLDRPPRH